mmetsp:Transcript_4909/g.6010  ORF Transcript_4909/g.6010 Transcript_4909/m.6010 type:complete len:286 (-) Transcript_4909:110-967(-)
MKWGRDWCDNEFGWGPTVGKAWAVAPCFSSSMFEIPTVLLFFVVGAPRLAKLLYKYPLVKPAGSLIFYSKLLCSFAALTSAVLMTVYVKPRSLSNLVALGLTAFAWLLSITLLVLGYHRAEPQKFCGLRFWWVTEFFVQLIIFTNYSILKPGELVHIFRGVYLGCCLGLVTLNLFPIDQAPYVDVVLDEGEYSFISSASRENLDAEPSDRTPLLSQQRIVSSNEALNQNLSEISPSFIEEEGEKLGGGLDRQLSVRLMYTGASTSSHRELFEAWSEELNKLGTEA